MMTTFHRLFRYFYACSKSIKISDQRLSFCMMSRTSCVKKNSLNHMDAIKSGILLSRMPLE